jgi:hypothetical protein
MVIDLDNSPSRKYWMCCVEGRGALTVALGNSKWETDTYSKTAYYAGKGIAGAFDSGPWSNLRSY